MSGPGKSYRKGITLLDAVKKFDTEDKAEAWFVEQRWPSGVACIFCGSLNVAIVATRKPQPFRCREKECRKSFSVKTGTLLHSSNLPLSKWAIAFFLYATNLKGVFQHEAAPRPRHSPKLGVVHGAPGYGRCGPLRLRSSRGR